MCVCLGMDTLIRQQIFTFSPFEENTYILYDTGNNAVVIDPGCYDHRERQEFSQFVTENNLQICALLNTHAHLDHVFGNAWVRRTYHTSVFGHVMDHPILQAAERSAAAYGVNLQPPGMPDHLVEHGQLLTLGRMNFQVMHIPGHCPGHVAYYHAESGQIWSGDVLFRNSIGRFDFPLSNYQDLMHSILEVLGKLPPDTRVWPGHGPGTTIGYELAHNPFIKEYAEQQ